MGVSAKIAPFKRPQRWPHSLVRYIGGAQNSSCQVLSCWTMLIVASPCWMSNQWHPTPFVGGINKTHWVSLPNGLNGQGIVVGQKGCRWKSEASRLHDSKNLDPGDLGGHGGQSQCLMEKSSWKNPHVEFICQFILFKIYSSLIWQTSKGSIFQPAMFVYQNVTLGFGPWSVFDRWIVPMVPGRCISISLSPQPDCPGFKAITMSVLVASAMVSGDRITQTFRSRYYPSSYRWLWLNMSALPPNRRYCLPGSTVQSEWSHLEVAKVNFWLTLSIPESDVYSKWACLKKKEPPKSPRVMIHFGLFGRKPVDFRVPDFEIKLLRSILRVQSWPKVLSSQCILCAWHNDESSQKKNKH